MRHTSLAARYRPQTFADVAGQDMVKAVLSRAAAEGRPAAAYLLSGTRGVGKTTIARIFAKALNCEHAPVSEPCNECPQCRRITQGAYVDVAEIDGASNNSVDDARALRENITYAPMEGSYKIFIIDEAHMLSRHAFNALLKTLEEPPPRVVFVFATTEAHRFPLTIVSRCQHFVFRHLTEEELCTHLSAVLRNERIPFEESAARLIAKRAAGSVRDGMSLLDQALALGGASLTTAGTREVLGMAGQEIFAGLFDAMRRQDCTAVATISRQVLHAGLDIGFFVQELVGQLRGLFLACEGGAPAVHALQLSADEAAFLQAIASGFSAAHLHSAWQMALEARRGIVYHPEPAAALELLLLNLALLPRLLPVDRLASCLSADAGTTHDAPVNTAYNAQAAQSAAAALQETADSNPCPATEAASAQVASASDVASYKPRSTNFRPDWEAFCDFCVAEHKVGRPSPPPHLLVDVTADWQGEDLRLTIKSQILYRQMESQRAALLHALAAFGAQCVHLTLTAPPKPRGAHELMEQFSRHPGLQPCFDVLGATLEHCTDQAQVGTTDLLS
ncbi:DNA polymerase III subunit gamma/tau [Deltaproteobacteria bacterium]|nr:DNA polymerase III subunit gamma/tau [Deltaproteobacteria bacterium]